MNSNNQNSCQIRTTARQKIENIIHLDYFRIRNVQIVLLFFYNFIVFTHWVNLSVAIVAIVDNKDNTNLDAINWDELTRGIILSSFIWGVCISGIPAGFIVQRIKCTSLISTTIMISSIFTILLPFVVTYNWQSVCAVRFVNGMMLGFWQPCMNTMLSAWVRPTDRTFLATIVNSGAQIGVILMLLVSAPISISSFGWPGIFYVSGCCGILWTIIWHCFGSNSPEEYFQISTEENVCLLTNSPANRLNYGDLKTLPLRKIITSSSFWALIVGNCGSCLAYGFFLAEIPTYIKNILNFNIQSSALLSSVPFVIFFCVSPALGYTINLMIKRKYCSIGTARKIGNSIGMIGPTICLIILGYVQENVVLAMILLTTALTLECGINSGSFINHLDLSPNYSGFISGVTSSIGNIIAICGPILVGYIVTDKNDPILWRTVFYILGTTFCFCNLIFCIWGSGEVQHWNEINLNKTKTKENKTVIMVL